MLERIVSLVILSCLAGAVAFGEEREAHEGEPRPTVSPSRLVSTAELDRDREALGKNEVNDAWFRLAQKVLDHTEKAEATRLLDRMPDAQRKAFDALVKARFERTPDELKKAARGEVEGRESALAAISEWKRRLEDDPSVALIGDVFKERPENAARHEDLLRKAIEGEDEDKAAEIAISLIYSLNKDQKKEALDQLKKERVNPEVVASARRLKQVERLLWAMQEIFKEPRPSTASALEKKFKDKIEKAFAKADASGNQFYDNLEKAANGDDAALKKLLETYTPQTLLDFMASQKDYQNGDLAVKLAKSLGWKDANGNVHLDVKAPDATERRTPAGTTPPAEPESQTWSLGKSDDEIRKALHAFDAPAGGHEQRLQQFSLDRAPAGAGGRHFFQPGDATHRPISYTPRVLYPEDKNFCSVEDRTNPKSVQLSQAAGWFFRPFPDSNFGSYAGSREHGVSSPSSPSNASNQNENIIVDMATGREIPMPGPYDPVPTTDELYMTVPNETGLTFYDMKSLLAGKPQEIFIDKAMGGVYQSVGQLASLETGISKYRIITDLKGLSYRDYEIARGPGGSATVRPLGDGPKRLCEGKDLALPMLSKDGKLLSAVDIKTNTTKIFNVEDGKCDEKIDLGIFTSKVDFSYDKKKIVFHKMGNEKEFRPANPYTRHPSDDYVSNIYTYDLESGELGRLTNNTDSNAVYPAFRRDGKVTFIQHPHRGGGDAKPSSLVTADPGGARKTSLDHFLPKGPARPAADERLQAHAALGALWSQLCSPHGQNLSTESAVLSTFNLDPARCKQMVEKYWAGFKKGVTETKSLDNARFKAADLDKMTPEKLLAACPKPSVTPAPPPSPVVSPPVVSPPVAVNPVPVSCRHCHRGGTVFPIPFDDAEALKATRPRSPASRAATLAQEIMDRVRDTSITRRMPPAPEPTLSADEIARLQAHVNR